MVCPHCACLGLRGLGADPLPVAYCSLLPKLLSQSPHGFQPSSPGPHELGGGSSFFMSPEAEDKPFLQSVVWRLPLQHLAAVALYSTWNPQVLFGSFLCI